MGAESLHSGRTMRGPSPTLPSILLIACLASPAGQAQRAQTSGGPLAPEQAAYDVRSYDLELAIDVERRSIDGRLGLRAAVVHPIGVLLLDLDEALEISGVEEDGRALDFDHRAGRVRIDLDRERQPGETLELAVSYAGRPRVARRPPWDGGFTWRETPSGEPWIATSCQGEGADLWWPCKDHPSDEPDSMSIRVTVPEPLVCASNGRLESVEEREDGKRTWHWFVSTPINNYCVALNIGPYVEVAESYTSVAGDEVPVRFWVLPENLEKGRAVLPEFLDHLRFMEELFGPYPFRADKYGVVETPHLGMEHQTIIAYGYRYRRDREFDYDWLHHHELSHEWWGNMVTAADWSDFWIHEGFGTYAQSLYVEKNHGPAGYRRSMARHRAQILSQKPLAPREAQTTRQMSLAASGRGVDQDVYYKGAWVLHTLRHLIGDEAFFRALRRMAYPDPALERVTDGSCCRFATTEDFVEIAEGVSERELGWFFEVYLRQPALPRLVVEEEDSNLKLRWETPGDLPFPMPIDVRIAGEVRRVEPGEELGRLDRDSVEIDPEAWILREED